MKDLTPSEMEALTKAMGNPLNLTTPAPSREGVARLHLSPLHESMQTEQNQFSLSEAALKTPVQLEAVLGKTTLTIAELLDVRPGKVITLDVLAGDLVNLEANGTPIAKGEIVVVDHHYAIRIIEPS